MANFLKSLDKRINDQRYNPKGLTHDELIERDIARLQTENAKLRKQVRVTDDRKGHQSSVSMTPDGAFALTEHQLYKGKLWKNREELLSKNSVSSSLRGILQPLLALAGAYYGGRSITDQPLHERDGDKLTRNPLKDASGEELYALNPKTRLKLTFAMMYSKESVRKSLKAIGEQLKLIDLALQKYQVPKSLLSIEDIDELSKSSSIADLYRLGEKRMKEEGIGQSASKSKSKAAREEQPQDEEEGPLGPSQ